MRRAADVAGIFGSVALLAVAAGLARATSVRVLTLDRAVSGCSAIFEGTVRGSEVRRGVGPSGRARAFTHHDFGDLRVHSGSIPTSNVLVPVIGGTLDGVTLRVPGAPSFEKGARYLVMYDPRDTLCAVAGWWQGAFRIRQDAAGEARLYLLDGRPAGEVKQGRVVAGETPMAVADLVAEIRAAEERARAAAGAALPGAGR